MISDSKIEYLFDLLNKNQSLAQAARTVGISYKTAMKYRDADRLPSEMRFSGSTKQTRLIEDHWEKDVLPYLAEFPSSSAQQLLDHLISLSTDRYNPAMIRTLQRRLKEWHERPPHLKTGKISLYTALPGELCITGYARPPMDITIRSVALQHELFLFYLPFSRWIYLIPITNKDRITTLELFEDILWTLGFVPRRHSHTSRIRGGEYARQEYDYSGIYWKFCRHYKIDWIEQKLPWPPHYNEIRKMIHHAYNGYFSNDSKSINFSMFHEYRQALALICNNVNAKIPEFIWSAAKAGSLSLPAQGFARKYYDKVALDHIAG